MVNIGGRSRGCLTCRNSRVKCDEGRPVCRRCRRLNLECGGPRGMAFIIHEKAAPLSSPPSTTGFDVYICYTKSQLLRGGLMVSAINDTKADDLMPVGTAVASRRVSHQAIMGFATLLFGIQHKQPDTARQGYVMHGVALRQLNHALSDVTRHSPDDVILAVAALAISELLLPTTPDSCWTHMMGLDRLLDLQDPVSFWSTKSPGFCKGIRFMIVAAALQLGRPSILARPEWKRAMRANASCQELEGQDLYDALADCSVLLAEGNAMSSAETADPTMAKTQQDDKERQACGLLRHLHQWRQNWNCNYLKIPIHTLPGNSSWSDGRGEDPEASIITIAAIPNLPAATMLMLYNLALMHVLRVLRSQSPDESSTRDFVAQVETAKSMRIDERIAARETCRCTQYYLSVKGRLDASAPEVIHWAIAVAWEILRLDDSAEGIWMRDFLARRSRQVVAPSYLSRLQ
ncbi:hypothetical protein QBC47DRAFT_425480 [Echria macrotheca]|uniref:Zn(2)-C6 fungal-type domain-containing protein n=1 Tax=Echria macrotheca TaxID=438768 RepID=A0AAJ0F1K2_9PEZI|nr:hypothetical protein QBC47DRAFT_425480 [Echria macrotheca]